MHGFTKHWKYRWNDRRCHADWINQAEALSDGERIYVPTQEEAEESAQSVSGQWADPNGNAGGSVSDKININTVTKKN